MQGEIKELQGHCLFDQRFLKAWHIERPVFKKHHFEKTLHELVQFPERTSSAILRAEILATETSSDENIPGYTLTHRMHRRILPRRPALDTDMLQDCFFFNSEDSGAMLVVFRPLDLTSIPFYHPKVAALAFHYDELACSIAYEPLSNSFADDRLNRTLRMLLQIIVKHATGHANDYQKRVHHDLIVPRDAFQDANQRLKRTYAARYYQGWIEKTDPGKHVFEDLCITAFLLELWKCQPFAKKHPIRFVDVGCGNGLLVDLLVQEGKLGYGFDLRARKSWSSGLYSPQGQAQLKEMILQPQCFMSEVIRSSHIHDGIFRSDEFLIGNHADELTPWIPVLSALSTVPEGDLPIRDGEEVALMDVPGFLIIPCCMHIFSGAKHSGSVTKGKAEGGGRYAAYVAFLQQVCTALGFVTLQEALRIPSTRNKALVAMQRWLVEDIGVPIAERAHGRHARLLALCKTIIVKHGGADEFLNHTIKLAQSTKVGH
ncbi:hypothetical protein BCR37DRAFT_133618 [Protomyces lactucae-debilis]|uniref:tRNA (uracil-O(2)-)-methyltransferase n=1 Tax=Protomyces lactucae-debilis TaxID=2754530 RepID=A0A1Y2FSR1_PROLT|nr:uncharacterized protein BCR37DRAFT_133618 [Protomyces lactucae-debilis]ORY87008.1 hypothetical protein BCR37DRAFT_133618 [Protomyces lactucae-debilis]